MNKQTQESEGISWDIPSSAMASKFLLQNQNTYVLSQQDTQQSIHGDKSGRKGLVQNWELAYEHGLWHLLTVPEWDPEVNFVEESQRKYPTIMKDYSTGAERSPSWA